MRQQAAAVADEERNPAAGAGRSSHEVFPAFVLARIDLAEGDLAAARRGFEASLAIWKQAGRESSAAAGRARLLLGETLQRQGERAAAAAELREAYEILFRRSGANDPDTRRAKALLDALARPAGPRN